MTSRNVTKVLAGMEDLLTGVGTVTQNRNGTSMPITKVDIAFAVATTAAMQALDVTKYTRARVYTSESNVIEYLYDSTDNTGLSSDTGPGTWLLAPESTKVLGVEDKISLRLTEPSFALQLAVALGAASLGVGYGGVYWYDENDTTTADDGDSVLVTTGGARWKRVSFEFVETPQLCAAGGTANALTASFGLSVVPTDRLFWLTAAVTNTGTMTLDIDSTGALPIQYVDGSALSVGAFELGKTYAVVKVGSTYRVLNPSCSSAGALTGTDNFGLITALRLAAVLAPIKAQALVDTAAASGTVLDAQVFTASGTWAKPVTALPTDTVIALIWSGGSPGYAARGGALADLIGAGAGGGFFMGYCRVSDLASTQAVVVAPTTVGVVKSSGTGLAVPLVSTGGDSTFAGITVLGAGIPYNYLTKPVEGTVDFLMRVLSATRAAGFLEFGGHWTIPGVNALIPQGPAAWTGGFKHASNTNLVYGGDSLYGGGGGGLASVSTPGGASTYGGDGGNGAGSTGATDATAQAGVAPGGGGGAAHAAGTGIATSGDGARGEVRIYTIRGWHPVGFPIVL